MARAVVPSVTQARLLARLWGSDTTAAVGGYIDPTTAACVARGWLAPTARMGTYPNGDLYVEHMVSSDGADALEDFLRKQRYQRRGAE